jgi:hypothetical protein
MEERPAYTVTLIRNFLDSPHTVATTRTSLGEERAAVSLNAPSARKGTR